MLLYYKICPCYSDMSPMIVIQNKPFHFQEKLREFLEGAFCVSCTQKSCFQLIRYTVIQLQS